MRKNVIDAGGGVAEEQAWQEYWAGGDGGDAVGGPQRRKLAAHWAGLFTSKPDAPQHPLVVDIAAGRGAALKGVMEALAHRGRFLALDFSPAAVRSAGAELPGIIAAAADAARLPLADHSVDAAISQFGIEYAGLPAFSEAARIVRPGGQFCSISHYRGGAIDAECAENERLLLLVGQGGLLSAARATLDASFAARSQGSANPLDARLEAVFASAFVHAKKAVDDAPPSAARATLDRFLGDLMRLLARRIAYEAKDALGWIEGMKASLDAYLRRMQSMRASALGADEVADVERRFSAAGLGDFRAEPLRLEDNKAPAAWVIEARRPPRA
ncbi:MAG: methyltransferase domain-containing protein [Parvularculaceae bacterium]|nr:methyltransferase domain-containing protein [Parvularculaceae bacterium]